MVLAQQKLYQFGLIAKPELAVDAFFVGVHGVLTDAQTFTDGL